MAALVTTAVGLAWCAAHWIYHAPLLHSETSTFSLAERDDEYKYDEWCNWLPRFIIPRICDYYKQHPERFKATGKGEEIEIEGFADFVKNDGYLKAPRYSRVRWGKVRDPWGDPLHFVEDLNMDGFIEAGGERRPVWTDPVFGEVTISNEEHHFGILKQGPFTGPNGHPWEKIFAMTFRDARIKKPQPLITPRQ